MSKKIALTFDDGPNTTTTMEVLDVLKKYGVVASFFLIADEINEESEKSVKACVEHGCEICNHSKTHSDMTKLSADEIRTEIEYTDKKIMEITGYKPRFFRPPFILVNENMVKNIDRPFICGINGEDWVPEIKAKERAEKILADARDGSIILAHDFKGNEETVKALDILIPELLKDGYEFVNISKLFEDKKVVPTIGTGIVYSNTDDVTPREYDA